MHPQKKFFIFILLTQTFIGWNINNYIHFVLINSIFLLAGAFKFFKYFVME